MYKLQTTLCSFWSRQIIHVKKEGYVAVRRKARLAIIKLLKLPINLAAFTLAVPLVLFVRLIRPLKLLRFGYFFAGRIGHFAFDVEYYLTENKLGIHPNKTIDLLEPDHIPNLS